MALSQEQKAAIRNMLRAKYEIDEETIERAVLRAEESGTPFPEHQMQYLCLASLFSWADTPEGFGFWENIFDTKERSA